MKRYDLSRLMRKAWSIFKKAARKVAVTFSAALKKAWEWLKVQDSNRKAIEAAAVEAGYGEQIVHTWYGWKMEGREVCHTEKAAFKVQLQDPTTKAGTRWESFFTYEQTFQPIA